MADISSTDSPLLQEIEAKIDLFNNSLTDLPSPLLLEIIAKAKPSFIVNLSTSSESMRDRLDDPYFYRTLINKHPYPILDDTDQDYKNL